MLEQEQSQVPEPQLPAPPVQPAPVQALPAPPVQPSAQQMPEPPKEVLQPLPATEASGLNLNPLKDLLAASQQQGQALNLMQWFLVGIVVVLFTGYVALLVGYLTSLVDSNKDKNASYRNLESQVLNQSSKIDILFQRAILNPSK